MLRPTTFFATAAAVAGLSTLAAAHTPYIVPTTFAPDREFVTISAGVTEGNYFVPDFPIRGPGDYLAIGPDGQTIKLGAGVTFKEMTIVEAALPKEGTWRISTGERPGRTAEWARIDGQWRAVRPSPAPGAPPPPPMAPRPAAAEGEGPPRLGPVEASAVPPDAPRIKSVAYQKSETFVSRGAPSGGALKASGQGFELTPQTHPNEIYAGEAFRFALTQDGQPVSAAFHVVRAHDAYAEKRFSISGATDAAGKGSVTFDEPGVYVLEARYPVRGEGPAAEPPAKSTGYTLTLEVTR